MDSTQIFNSINKLLTTHFSREFWLNVQEEFEVAYAKANAIAEGPQARLENPQIARFRPQARHYFLNAALHRAAKSSVLTCIDAVTEPKGEFYCIVQSAGIRISRIGLNHDENMMKRARHRTLIAKLNSELEGFTPDFFQDDANATADETLGILIVNVNPPVHTAQGKMLDLRVTVPFTNLKNYHYNESINAILALYNQVESVQEIPDLAIPQLKKRLKEQEG